MKEITAKGSKGFARLHFHSIIDGDEASSRHSILNKEGRAKHARKIDLIPFSLRPRMFFATFAVKYISMGVSDRRCGKLLKSLFSDGQICRHLPSNLPLVLPVSQPH